MDLISRQAAIDAIDDIGSVDTYADRVYAKGIMRMLPSVQPDLSGYSDRLWKNAYEMGKRDAMAERKTGRWMGWFEPGNENYHCSACGTAWYPSDLYLGGNDYPKYCPECGAQMENWRSGTEEGAQDG